MEDIIRLTGKVPKNLVKRGMRMWWDGAPDEETRLEAKRLVDTHLKGGVIGSNVSRKDVLEDPLGGFV
jgi:hypothetical protein